MTNLNGPLSDSLVTKCCQLPDVIVTSIRPITLLNGLPPANTMTTLLDVLSTTMISEVNGYWNMICRTICHTTQFACPLRAVLGEKHWYVFSWKHPISWGSVHAILALVTDERRTTLHTPNALMRRYGCGFWLYSIKISDKSLGSPGAHITSIV